MSVATIGAVSEGIWATTVPFPSALGYSYSYAVWVESGVVVVDLGWNSADAWQAFLEGLDRASMAVSDIVGVVVTHVHPDHYGLASTLKQHTDAWIAAHPAELRNIAATPAARTKRVEEMTHWLAQCGVPADQLDGLHAETAEIAATLPTVAPDIELTDGDVVPQTDGVLVAIHTPGHTAGHLCFHDRGRNVLLTGDHLLPRVTPNVSKRPGSEEDPLSDFTDSLRRINDLRPSPLILPGHEWSFDRPDNRVAALLAHHQSRLDDIETAVVDGARTVWEVATTISWSRPFNSLAPRAQRQAVGETSSHLAWLWRRGRLTVVAENPTRYEPVVTSG